MAWHKLNDIVDPSDSIPLPILKNIQHSFIADMQLNDSILQKRWLHWAIWYFQYWCCLQIINLITPRSAGANIRQNNVSLTSWQRWSMELVGSYLQTKDLIIPLTHITGRTGYNDTVWYLRSSASEACVLVWAGIVLNSSLLLMLKGQWLVLQWSLILVEYITSRLLPTIIQTL